MSNEFVIPEILYGKILYGTLPLFHPPKNLYIGTYFKTLNMEANALENNFEENYEHSDDKGRRRREQGEAAEFGVVSSTVSPKIPNGNQRWYTLDGFFSFFSQST